MKRVLLAMFLLSAVIATQAAPRTVLFESFTNTSCPYCPAADQAQDQVLQNMGRDIAVCVRYHVWWPGRNDPFYLYNRIEDSLRVLFYGINSVPALRIDGILTPSASSSSQITNAIGQRRGIPSPCTIDVTTLTMGPTIQATAIVTAEEDMSNDIQHLFLALIHNDYQVGGTEYKYPFCDMAPSTAGEPISLAPEETHEYTAEFSTEPRWDLENMTVIAFVQNLSTKEIHQAAYADVDLTYSMELTASSAYTRMIPIESSGNFIAILTNMGIEADTYTAAVSGDFPDGWTKTIEVQGGTADPDEVSVSLAPYASATLIVRMNANGMPGTGDITITATSQTVSEITSDVDFIQHTGLDVLVVDDDEGSDYESYFTAALEPLSEAVINGVWDITYNTPTASDLGQVACVIWMTGNSPETLSETEQTMLAEYLNGGGSLILSGQKIGFDIGNPNPGTSFFTDYLHADFITPYYQGRTVYGVTDDPISGGMSFDIYGGTGANNQTSQADIDPLDAMATTFLTYSEGTYNRNAALRIETGTYRAIYLAFGFEGIADDYNRNLLMANMLGWLGTISAVESEAGLPPVSFNLGEGFPNPFNPVVTIPFALAERTPVRLSVYDILGREVAVLVSETMNPGAHTVQWDASALSSGVYFSRLTAGSQAAPSFTATKKLILLK